MIKFQKLKITLVVCLLLFVALSVSAAELFFEPKTQELGVDQQFQVDLILDTENEEINAIEGKVIFPENLLELKEIRDGATIINFWIERPKIEHAGIVAFSGIIPGGYTGEKGLIFSAVFQSKNQGEDTIKIQEAKTLLNDGKGTPASLEISDLQFLISKQTPISQIPISEIKDTELPESFVPEIVRDPTIFDGKYFLVFATQDKDSGIDHYEILEKEQKGSIWGLIKKDEWQVGESPYLLKDQKIKSHIFVKAIDKNGNERIITLSPQNPLKWYENYFVLLIIIISMIFVFITWRRAKKFSFGVLFLLSIILATVGLALPVSVFAASLYLSPATGSYNVGQTFSASVYVSSTDQAMNALSGVISFPADKLEAISLSKSGSIITLWVQEPTLSNTLGTVNFEGIVLNPGFTGSSGKIITVNFKTKAVGLVPVTFSSGSVLANDGKGTNILASMSSGSYVTQTKIITPPVEGYIPPKNTPTAPVVSSPTHPDSEKWYSNNDPLFRWDLSSDVTQISYELTGDPKTNPKFITQESLKEKSYSEIDDGTWYFHINFKNSYGWGEITHRKVLIDTVAPLPFEIKVKESKETTYPQPTVLFNTTDPLSGIEYYKVKIGESDFFTLSSEIVQSNPYTIPLQAPGKRTILVQAFDKAGNYTTAVEEFVILPIEASVITDYPQTLLPGATLSMKGTAVPEAQVKVYIQKDEKEIKTEETKSNKEGKWSYIGTESLEEGIYKIWVEATDSSGAISKPSEKVIVQVSPPVFIRIGKLAIDYLTTIITLLVLILAMVVGIVWTWQKIIKRKKRLRKETTEAERVLYQAFEALKNEAEEQIAKLDGKPDLNDREKKICDDLKKALKISEKIISKEIKDIEKELK